MIAILYLGGLAFVVALALMAVLASNGRRLGLVILLGVVLTAAWFVAVLLTASTNANHPNCEDCDYVWGRRWWPPLVLSVIGLNVLAWLVGAIVGWLARRFAPRISAPGGGRGGGHSG